MKIIPAKSEPSFKPVAVTFVFETQDEIDAMTTLFNHGFVCHSMDSLVGDSDFSDYVRTALVEVGGKIYHEKIVAEFVKHKGYVS